MSTAGKRMDKATVSARRMKIAYYSERGVGPTVIAAAMGLSVRTVMRHRAAHARGYCGECGRPNP